MINSFKEISHGNYMRSISGLSYFTDPVEFKNNDFTEYIRDKPRFKVYSRYFYVHNIELRPFVRTLFSKQYIKTIDDQIHLVRYDTPIEINKVIKKNKISDQLEELYQNSGGMFRAMQSIIEEKKGSFSFKLNKLKNSNPRPAEFNGIGYSYRLPNFEVPPLWTGLFSNTNKKLIY